MNEITLKHYLTGRSQKEAAEVLGCTQGAISQMLKSGREIYFRVDDSGVVVSFYENKLPGRKKAS